MLYVYNKHGVPCVRLEEIEHTIRDFSGSGLPAWKQSYLKLMKIAD